MRDRVKHLVERLLVSVLPLERRRAGLRQRALILALHNVISRPGDAGLDRSLHLLLDDLRGLLDALRPTHRFVSLADAFEAPSNASGKPPVAITFDDAYSGAIRLGLPLLADRSIPATVFVVPGRLGAQGMWWDTQARVIGGHLSEPERTAALTEARGIEEEVQTLGGRNRWIRSPVNEFIRLASLEELHWARTIPGVTFGSHSWSHPNLTLLDDADLHEELSRPIGWLRAEAGDAFRPWLAYPYGLSDARVAAAAESTGYVAAFRISGGWSAVPPDDPWGTPRLNLPAGITPNGLRLRGAGLFC